MSGAYDELGADMSEDQSIGSICLQTIASTWQVDDGATEWVDNGFDWTPGSHLVKVRAFPNEIEPKERWRITVRTDFLTSVSVEDPKFVGMAAVNSRFLTSTYSMDYPPAEIWKAHWNGEPAKLSFFSSIYVYAGTVGWLPRFFAREAIIQVVNAEIYSSGASELLFSGEPNFRPSGKNDNPDPILEVVETVYKPEGEKPSHWRSTNEFIEFGDKYGRSDGCFGMGDKSSLTLETPFGEDSALIRLRSDQRHPQLGSGLLVTIQIPFSQVDTKIQEDSAFLNFLEARRWTDFPQLGCWHPLTVADGKSRLAHTSFVPNALCADGIATNFAIWSVARVRWLRSELWPNLEDKPMSEVLQKRVAK
jgi:hypothetical protein